MVFDLSKPSVKAIKSTFGGGWVVPLNDDGRRVLTEYFGERRGLERARFEPGFARAMATQWSAFLKGGYDL